jgi:hypothetical protein
MSFHSLLQTHAFGGHTPLLAALKPMLFEAIFSGGDTASSSSSFLSADHQQPPMAYSSLSSSSSSSSSLAFLENISSEVDAGVLVRAALRRQSPVRAMDEVPPLSTIFICSFCFQFIETTHDAALPDIQSALFVS